LSLPARWVPLTTTQSPASMNSSGSTLNEFQ
jgi:hypothetical protein